MLRKSYSHLPSLADASSKERLITLETRCSEAVNDGAGSHLSAQRRDEVW
jgi:hypothetical protein